MKVTKHKFCLFFLFIEGVKKEKGRDEQLIAKEKRYCISFLFFNYSKCNPICTSTTLA